MQNHIQIDEDKSSPYLKPLKSFFSFILKHFIISSIVIMIAACALVVNWMESKRIEKLKADAQLKEDYKTQMFLDSHTKLQYYLETDIGENTIESAARLIAHTMESGCSTSYNILLDNFDSESMAYLQDFLLARTCEKYTTPPVVRLEQNELETSYLVRLGSNKNRYVVTIRTYNDGKVDSFKIELYQEQNKIETIN